MNKGSALLGQARQGGALAGAQFVEGFGRDIGISVSYEEMVKSSPEFANMLAGFTLKSQGTAAESIEAYDQAIRIYEVLVPVRRELGLDLANCYFNKGLALLTADQIEAASGTCEQAIALCVAFEKYDSRAELKSLLHESRQLRLQIEQEASQRPRVYPTEGPTVAQLAQRQNIEYQQALAAWQALPLLKRWRTKKPKPPAEV